MDDYRPPSMNLELSLHRRDFPDIKVAEYLTELPDKKLLKRKLHKVIEISKKLLDKS